MGHFAAGDEGHEASEQTNRDQRSGDQFNASGGTGYTWSPATYLSSNTIPDPIAIFNEASNGVIYKVIVSDESGCKDSAFVKIKVYQSAPTVFVPTAFTPNGDGRNDLLRPIAAGMSRIDYFTIFNRWGEMVYTSSNPGTGWDGKVNGDLQGPGTFIWMVKAIDYTGRPFFEKGTVTLIR